MVTHYADWTEQHADCKLKKKTVNLIQVVHESECLALGTQFGIWRHLCAVSFKLRA